MSYLSKVAARHPALRRNRWILILVVLVSFAMRSHDLGTKSLWTDEGLTLRRAEQPLGLVLKNQNLIPIEPNYHDGSAPEVVAAPDVHPPLFFLLMHFWVRAAGSTEFALRLPSVMASTLLLPILFALGSALLNREAGLWSVVLAAFSPFYTWHAQEARMYAWVVLFSAASVYAFLSLLEETPGWHRYLVYGIATAALLYTHYSGFLVLAFELIIYVGYQMWRRERIGPILIVLVILAAASIPLSSHLHRALNISLYGFVSRPLPVLLAEMWSYFSLGVSDFLVRPIWQTAPFLVLFAVGATMVSVPHRRKAWMVCLGYLAVPLMLFHILSYFRPNYMNPRHLLAFSPAWELVMAQGLVTLRRRFAPGLFLLLPLVLFLRGGANLDVFTSRSLWKDDIRGAAEYIEARARPGDAIVLHDAVIRLTFDYYYSGPCPVTAVPGYGERDEEKAVEDLLEWTRRYDRIWFLYGPPPTHFPKQVLPDWADTHLFKVDQQGFEALWTYVGVAAYDESPPVLDALPVGANPLDITWGPLRLSGFRADRVVQGNNGWLDLYWQADEAGLDQPLRVRIRFLDAAGVVWFEREEELLAFYPPSAWPRDGMVHTSLRLPVPDDLPPIVYKLEVVPLRLGEPRVIGEVPVARSNGASTPPYSGTRFDEGIVLVAGELGSDVFRAGHPLFGSLTWQATSSVDGNYLLRVRVTRVGGRDVVTDEMMPSAAGFPTSAWVQGDRVAGRLVLQLPVDLRSGRYRVQIGLIDASTRQGLPIRHWSGKRDWLSLGTVRVEAWPMITKVPGSLDQRLEQVEIGERVLLRGYDLDQEGDTLKLRLYWQAQESLDQNYHAFVHLGVRDQPPLADAAGVPANWTRPTTSWREGEIIVDEHTLSLSDVPPGRYALLVGLFEPDTGARPETVVSGSVVPGGYVFLEEVERE